MVQSFLSNNLFINLLSALLRNFDFQDIDFSSTFLIRFVLKFYLISASKSFKSKLNEKQLLRS